MLALFPCNDPRRSRTKLYKNKSNRKKEKKVIPVQN